MHSFVINLFSMASLLRQGASALPRSLDAQLFGERQVMVDGKHLMPSSRDQSTNLMCLSESSDIQDRRLQLKEIVILGSSALQSLKSNTKYTASPLSEKSIFIDWVKETSRRKLFSDKEFKERLKVRELKRLHLIEISGFEKKLFERKTVYELNPNSLSIDALDRAIINCQQACANMEKFLLVPPVESINYVDTVSLNIDEIENVGEFEGTRQPLDESVAEVDASSRSPLSRDKSNNGKFEDISNVESRKMNYEDVVLNKLEIKRLHVTHIYPLKRAELLKITREREILVTATPEHRAYMDSIQSLHRFLESIGLHAADKNVIAIQKGAGQGRNSRGKTFENTADSVLSDHLLPRLAGIHGCAIEDMLIVRNIKLGMASRKGTTAELDSVICIRVDRPTRMDCCKPKGSFCKVLAVVEVKRNPDDIGHAFLGYQKSLAWLSGQQGLYDPLDWQTKSYPKGHFIERPFLHHLNGETLIFSAESFSELRRKPVILDVSTEFSLFRSGNPLDNEPNTDKDDNSHGSSTRNSNANSNVNNSSYYNSNSSETRARTTCSTSVADESRGYGNVQNKNVREKDVTDIIEEDFQDCSPTFNVKQTHTNTEPLMEKLNDDLINEKTICNETSFFVEDLYFVSKDSTLDSVHSKALSWVLNKISSEIEFDNEFSNDIAVESLRLRVVDKHPHKLSTYDLVQMYLKNDLKDQLFLVK